MFLKATGDEAPEAVQDLFLIGRAEEWARKYHASAQWLIDFASQRSYRRGVVTVEWEYSSPALVGGQ